MNTKQQFAAMITPWEKLQRGRPLPCPLKSILGEEADPEGFTAEQLATLRTYAAMSFPHRLAPRELQDFAAEMFSSPEVITAYFRPTPVREIHGPKASFRMGLPFHFALKAGKNAARAAHLLAHERELAWIAGYAYPCGIFAASDPSLRSGAQIKRISNVDAAVALRQVLLRDALRLLRGRNHLLASTLAAVLDIGDPEDECDLQQVVRLVTAVRMGMTEIQQVWRGW